MLPRKFQTLALEPLPEEARTGDCIVVVSAALVAAVVAVAAADDDGHTEHIDW